MTSMLESGKRGLKRYLSDYKKIGALVRIQIDIAMSVTLPNLGLRTRKSNWFMERSNNPESNKSYQFIITKSTKRDDEMVVF